MFSNSIQPDKLVGEIDLVENEDLVWDLRWMRPIFFYDVHVFDNLLSILQALPPLKIVISIVGII